MVPLRRFCRPNREFDPLPLLKIARLGHPVLTQVAEPVPHDLIGTPEADALIDSMIETMRDAPGVGLAAPQIHHSLRLFVIEPGPHDEDDEDTRLRVLINPQLRFPDSSDRIELWEGCLSIPGLRGRTERHASVEVEYLDRHGETVTETFEGFAAAVVQHENDHLDGKFFYERMPQPNELSFEDEFERWQLGEDEEDEEV